MADTQSDDLEATINLVKKANDGNSVALEELFERYMPRVRRIVRFRIGRKAVNSLDIDDLVQESLLKAFQNLDQFDLQSTGRFHNWLARGVERQIIDHWRGGQAQKRGGGRERRFADCPADELSSTIFRGQEPTSSQVYRAKELESRIDAELLKMDEADREVIVLRQLCEMSYAEVAESLGLPSEAAARKAFSRALRKLKEKVSA